MKAVYAKQQQGNGAWVNGVEDDMECRIGAVYQGKDLKWRFSADERAPKNLDIFAIIRGAKEFLSAATVITSTSSAPKSEEEDSSGLPE
jgi:hypothetical protein